MVSAVGRLHAGMKEDEDSGFAFASFRVVDCGVRSGRMEPFWPGGPNGDLKIGLGEDLGEDFGEGEEGMLLQVHPG